MSATCPHCNITYKIYGVNPDNHKWFFIGKGNPHGYIRRCPHCGKDVTKPPLEEELFILSKRLTNINHDDSSNLR